LNYRRIVIKGTKIKPHSPETSADKVLKLLIIANLGCLAIDNKKLV